jgi:hypothetical protein
MEPVADSGAKEEYGDVLDLALKGGHIGSSQPITIVNPFIC